MGAAYECRPGFLVGWWEIQISDEIFTKHDDDDDSALEPGPWRIVFRTGGITTRNRRILPISKWQTDGHPLEDESIALAPLIREGVEIFGRVLAWASPEASSYWQTLTGTLDPDVSS
jgi:hypothetical protein